MNLFTILPVVSNDNTLPTISDITLLSDAEYGAFGHWLFGGGPDSLTGITSDNKTLITGTTAPLWSSNYVTLNGFNAGLKSTMETDSYNEVSLCMVFKTQSTLNSDVIAGNATTTGSNGGFFVGTNASNELYVTIHGVVNNLVIGSELQPDTWYFLGLSLDLTTGSLVKYTLSGISDSKTYTGNYISNADKISVGNSYINNASRPIDYAEFILFPYALSESGLNSVYNRSKSRMSDKGIVI